VGQAFFSAVAKEHSDMTEGLLHFIRFGQIDVIYDWSGPVIARMSSLAI